jgi:hypothetical protein
MNRFFPFISCAFVGILVSSCARNEPVYGSRSASPHRPAKHHHVALAQVPLRHPPRRAASEGQRRPLRPWNHLPAASETPAPANATTPPIRTSWQPPRPRRLRMPRRPPIRITSRQTPMSRHPLIPSRSGHPLIGAGKSDPSSKVTSNIRTKLTEPRTSTSAVDSKRPCVDDVSHSESTIYCCARAPGGN